MSSPQTETRIQNEYLHLQSNILNSSLYSNDIVKTQDKKFSKRNLLTEVKEFTYL